MILAKPQQPILDDGKHWEADKLNRKNVADYLTPLIESITQPFVISLASDYGTGKTFFIKCWRKDLEAKGLSCVYFNAWESDFSQDPLFAFISAMKKELAPLNGADAKFNEAAKKTGGLVARKIGVIATKALLRAGLGTDAARDVLELANIEANELADAAGAYAEERLRAQESAEKSMAEFKVYLEATVKELVADKDKAHRKIVVFVDDLDRCRPDYAISVLECIKHLFSVLGLVFVLSIDDRQLHQAVKAVYGPAIDSDGYLRRFIDWRFFLPKPTLTEFSLHLASKLGFDQVKNFKGDGDQLGFRSLIDNFNAFAIPFDLSLREIEQTFTEVNLCLRVLGEKSVPFSDILGAFAAIHRRYPEELREYTSGRLEARALFKRIGAKLSDSNFRPLGRNLSRHMQIMAVWALNETAADQVGQRINACSEEWNRINQKSEQSERAAFLRAEIDFLSPVHSMWRALSGQYAIYETSLASIVYMRLQAASTLISKQ